jgi:hypothetical protein
MNPRSNRKAARRVLSRIQVRHQPSAVGAVAGSGMRHSGISGEVRVIAGIPLRLAQNRDNTSWAEEYVVEAGASLRVVGMKPRRYRGPWRRIGSLRGDQSPGARWRVVYLPAAADDDVAEPETFNDGLALLVGRWKERRFRPAVAVVAAGAAPL